MITTMNPFDECYHSMNKDSTTHRVTVDTPEDVFLDRQTDMTKKNTLISFNRIELTNFLLSY